MKDRLSALLDGDLEEQAALVVLDRLQRDPALRQDWADYCLIGDALRGESPTSPDFMHRVMAGLENEPTVLAPAASGTGRAAASRRWPSLMPLAASLMGIAAVGFVASTLHTGETDGLRVATNARNGTIASMPAPSAPVVTDLQREYVFAHQGVYRSGPMPASVQYVRSVADVAQGGGR